MGQHRRDKTWPKPRHVRHVWVRRPGLQVPPVQGLVVEWRRHSYRWWALVAFVIDDDQAPTYVQQWLPAADLRPVTSQPASFKSDRY